MNAVLLVSIIGLLLVTVHAAHNAGCGQCGKNEEWTTCGTACPKSCEEPNPTICTFQCVIGCQCKQGFVLNKQRECIRPSDCCRD